MAKLRITLMKSDINFEKTQKRTVKALGLKKPHHTVIKEDNQAIRGMIFKVKHLLKVEEIKDGE
ncbi:MAG: 50S ribosomal protein L30 [bacterium]